MKSIKKKDTNNLLHEHSLYLRQHAHNPVHWYPWSNEALRKAKKEAKPIFLSIGYAACHWCHTMERECFHNPHIAKALNKWFISIKIDREERPDLDEYFMVYVQYLTGKGGWPLTVFLTPDLSPFFGGTYFPPQSENGRKGLYTILQEIHELWKINREDICTNADKLASALKSYIHPFAADKKQPDAISTMLDTECARLLASHDRTNGGFGVAPKFPQPASLKFLLAEYWRTGNYSLLEATCRTLDAIAMGGIHDHVAGGFHRYATDASWTIPHFEKMLYDNALLATVYLRTWQTTRTPEYSHIARKTLDFMLCEMRTGNAPFCASLDADSNGIEGDSYLWKESEIRTALSSDEADHFITLYQLCPVHTPRGDIRGVLRRTTCISSDTPAQTVQQERTLQKLREFRLLRPSPTLDTKILTSWNGMAIKALSLAGSLLNDPRYLHAAERAADWLMHHHHQNGQLLHASTEGKSKPIVFLEDYAWFITGLTYLFSATGNAIYLQNAIHLTEECLKAFYQPDLKSLRFTPLLKQQPDSNARNNAPICDHLTPNPVAVLWEGLAKLAILTEREDFLRAVNCTKEYLLQAVPPFPEANHYALMLCSLELQEHGTIVILGKEGSPDTAELETTVRHYAPPSFLILTLSSKQIKNDLQRLIPCIQDLPTETSKPSVHICLQKTCEPPLYTIEAVRRRLCGTPPEEITNKTTHTIRRSNET